MSDPLEKHLRDAERKAHELLAILHQAKLEAERLDSVVTLRIDPLLSDLEEKGDGEEAHRPLIQRLDNLIRNRRGEIRSR